ncbi:MAG TPA: class II aldolase/adducin family protein [Methanomassiliicoccales archaeon]|nr:class II aldolase/adducin family protein [Methanomassiliicoccales archaeon]
MDIARLEIVEYGALLYEKGLMIGTSGNISIRGEDGIMLITPSGSCKGLLTAEDLIEVRIIDGSLVKGGKPSIETPFHLTFYRDRPDVNAVVHCHPMFCTVLAVAGVPLETGLTPESLMVLGLDVPTVPYATPGTEDLAQGLKGTGRTCAFLLEKHGAITVGGSMKEAFHRMETLEFTAEMQYRLSLIEKGKPLPAGEREQILKMVKH